MAVYLNAGASGNTSTNSDIAGGEPIRIMGSSVSSNNGDWRVCANTQYIPIRADGNCPANPITTANGTTATFYVKVNPGLTKTAVSSGGGGYSGVPILTFSGCLVNPTGTVTQSGGVINSVTIDNPGVCNGTTPTYTISGGTTAAVLTLTQASGCTSACGTVHAGLPLFDGGLNSAGQYNGFNRGFQNAFVSCNSLYDCVPLRDLGPNEQTQYEHLNLHASPERCFDIHTFKAQNMPHMRDIRCGYGTGSQSTVNVGTQCGFIGDGGSHGLMDWTCDLSNLSISVNDGLRIDADEAPAISVINGHAENVQFGIFAGEGSPSQNLSTLNYAGPPNVATTADGAWQSEPDCAIKVSINFAGVTPGTDGYAFRNTAQGASSAAYTICDDYASSLTGVQYYFSGDSGTTDYEVDNSPAGLAVLTTASEGSSYLPSVIVANESPSGAGVTIQNPSTTTAFNFNLPTTAGTSGQPLLSGGGGSTAMSFGTLGVSAGGTGDVSLTTNGVLYGNGTSAVSATSQGLTNSILTASAGAPTFSQTPTINTSLTIGVNATQAGSLLIANGNSSGAKVTIQNPSATTAYNFNLPTSAGTSGQPLLSGGGGSTAMTFGTLSAGAGGTGSTNGAIGTLCAGVPNANMTATTEYVGFGVFNATESSVYVPVPVSGTAAAMHVQMSASSSNTITFKAKYGNNSTGTSALTGLSCNISGSATSCDATGGTSSVTEGSGNVWDIEVDGANGVGARNYMICIKVTAAN